MWRQVVSQTPREATSIDGEHPYARAAAQLNELIRGGRSLSGHERNCLFLNTRGKRFATASSVSGFDFEDDGRAIVRCDWEFDGDIDFWVANRSAPQLRFLQNRIGTKNNFVAFRLRGTSSNRDAIGARVELQTEGGQTLVQAVRAGEGFLSQSSKTIHFGLGEETVVRRLSVRWPNGDVEQFPIPEAVNGFFNLVEGSGTIAAWKPPKATVASTEVTKPSWSAPPFTQATANSLGISFPLPPLQYADSTGIARDATQLGNQPLAINLWATWCGPCIEELKDWQQHQSTLAESNIRVIAISTEPDPTAADTIEELGITFDLGIASESMLETIQFVHNTIYDHHERIPIPTTLLVNESGHLVALFKGGVTAEQLSDALALSQNDDPNSRLPFPGRWIGQVGGHKLSELASTLWDAGLTDEALQFADRIDPTSDAREWIKCRLKLAHRLRQQSEIKASMDQLQRAYQIAPQDADVNLQIGDLQAEYGKLPLAAGHYLIALENATEPRPKIHANLGSVLRRLNKFQDAEEHLAIAIQLDPRLATAHYNLGLLRASQSRYSEAVQDFEQAVLVEPDNATYRINFAIALSRGGQHREAIEELDRVLAAEPDSLTARIYKGEAYAEAAQIPNAIAEFERVAAKSPNATRVWMRLGQLQEQQGMWEASIRSFQKVLALAPDDPRPAVRIAWILATAPDEVLRDGRRAVELAESVVAKTNRTEPFALDALAAAYAENNQFDKAIATCREALSLFSATQDGASENEVSIRLRLYEQGRKFRTRSPMR